MPQRLLFEVTSANVVKDPPSKYVVSAGPGAPGCESTDLRHRRENSKFLGEDELAV